MPSFIDEHSDEVVASSARAGHCDAHAHLRQLHPHELQQQNRNTDDQDIVHTLRAIGIAKTQFITAGGFVEGHGSSSPLCIAPPFDRRVKVDDELVGVALCDFGVRSRTWCVFVRFVFALPA